jgi:Protein of unknown function (DUF2934)
MMALSPETQPRSFDSPQEPEWHRMIAEAAYYLAQKRGFTGQNALDDWLVAEQEIRQVISPTVGSEATMNDMSQNQSKSDAKALEATEQAADSSRHGLRAKPSPVTPQHQGVSRFEKFAATQAAGDGIQGDTLKKDKSVHEKIGANMADRK